MNARHALLSPEKANDISLRSVTSSIASQALTRGVARDVGARRFGALGRVRKVRDAAGLLRPALMHGRCGLSLRAAAAASDAAVAALSDKAVPGRQRNMTDWRKFLPGQLLAQTRQRDSNPR
jgi:hypothetical protein